MPIRSKGTYRGDKDKWFPTNCVRFLTREELLYIKEVVSFVQFSYRFISIPDLQHADSSDEQQQKVVFDVHIIDFSKQNFSISKCNLTKIVFNRLNGLFIFRCYSFSYFRVGESSYKII